MCRYIKAQTPRGLLAALVLCSLSLLPGPLARAQGFAHGFTQSSAAEAPGLAESSFSYKFENPRFIIPLLEVDVSADGSGQVRFKRGESDEIIDFNLKLTPATLARIRRLLESSRFFGSSEEYQSKKDFSYLGWMTISARQGERERTVRFNHTTNLEIKELADLFRAIATQGMHLFNIETSQQYQPLDLPGQLQALEDDLRLQRVAEPERMLAVLREIAGNDTAPLIARNHASRLVSAIEKKKYKSMQDK
ncbi:MAG TPA: hypothetical protein VKC34_18305 [Blastocatellia bacterium]|nr:hypothetical protein [Blastocatellia bacterium]